MSSTSAFSLLVSGAIENYVCMQVLKIFFNAFKFKDALIRFEWLFLIPTINAQGWKWGGEVIPTQWLQNPELNKE